MIKKIFRSIFLISLAMLAITLVMIFYFEKKAVVDMGRNDLEADLSMTAQIIEEYGSDAIPIISLYDKNMVLLTEDELLYSSRGDALSFDEFINAKDISEAFYSGYGEDIRKSHLNGDTYIYAAKQLSDGSVLAMSVNHSKTAGVYNSWWIFILAAFAFMVIFGAVLGRISARNIVKPLNELDMNDPLSSAVYPEIRPAMEHLDYQQKQLIQRETELHQKANEFSAIVENMNEGIILLNADGNVLHLNSAAADILDISKDCMGTHILEVRDTQRMHEIMDILQKGGSTQVVLEKNSFCYQINASPIISDNDIIGFVLAMFDVTNREEAKRIRRDFTANVSHELKTPLHTISGCAELLSYNMVKPEDVHDFAATIYKESLRMIHLVEDIIELAHLEIKKVGGEKVYTDLLSTAQDAVASLQLEADEANVAISCQGDSAVLFAVPHLLQGIVYDLCDNAIKYNKPGGTVEVIVEDHQDEAVLIVKDTGIGIAPEHQSRVFERFYRVDKSHSKDIGGTGLGLSIVKHAVNIQNARIKLDSELGKGSTFTVTFPKEPNITDGPDVDVVGILS